MRARTGRDAPEELQHAKRKYVVIKFLGMPAQQYLTPNHIFEHLDRFAQRAAVWMIEEDAGLAVDHSFSRAAGVVSDDGTTGSIRLERRHAEVLFPREQQCAAARQIIVNHRVRLAAEK